MNGLGSSPSACAGVDANIARSCFITGWGYRREHGSAKMLRILQVVFSSRAPRRKLDAAIQDGARRRLSGRPGRIPSYTFQGVALCVWRGARAQVCVSGLTVLPELQTSVSGAHE